ncbi:MULTISPECIES: hypothetical protein [unclassified Achromobacter]|uniref:hypothetical protein n=1 Tax=unclassified Achromobacter TaxID=2626865 RepID=UPI000B518AD1|nr:MULTISPECIES: hypothetical protein [unclassified Achromobacter]OWT69238.1 hypothetical protein CEY05_28880 [Achromobacter sp. HZ34]OWT70643.1 hypothetical protein CEY04_27710 [Achromobacter sp. HZ28]
MSETNDLIVLPPKETAMDVYTTPKGLDPYLQKIIARCQEFEPTVQTVKGRKEIASMAHKVSKVKVALDNLGKELVADLKELPKKIDAERKRMRDSLEALQEEVRAPLTAWENAEEARIQRHKDALAGIDAIVAMGGEASAAIQAQIAALDAILVDESWEEFQTEAEHVKAKAVGKLQEKLAARVKYEAEQEELAQLRKAAAEREQKDREAKIAKEAADKAKRAAEAKAQEERDAAIKREAEAKAETQRKELEAQLAVERAEREKADAIAAAERAKNEATEKARQAAEAERKRIADEQAAADAETKRREANRAHCGKINRAAMEALVKGGLPEDCAKKAIELIAKGKIPAVVITY